MNLSGAFLDERNHPDLRNKHISHFLPAQALLNAREDEKDNAMQNYHGIVEIIVLIGDSEYRVFFQAYDECNAIAA